MSISATALAGTTLPVPATYTVRLEYIGSATTLGDGSIRRDLMASAAKRRFTLSWVFLDATEIGDMGDAYDDAVTSAQTLTTPDGGSYSVMASPSPSLQFEAYVSGGTLYYRTTMELWEQ